MVTVVLVLITLGVAAVIGYARGGRLRRLLDLRPRRGRLLLTALFIAVAGVLAGWMWPAVATSSWSLALLAVTWFCILNRTIQGMALVAAGLGADAVGNLARLTQDPPGVLTILGDVIPVSLPWATERISPGGVLVAAGLAAILATSMVSSAPNPAVSTADDDDTLEFDQPKEWTDGEESTQAQEPEEEQREPRQAAQQLTRHLA